jgi:hypothetical protein
MAEEEATFSGELASSHEPQATFGKNRSCSWDGCEIKLSRYNPSDRCGQHPRSRIIT